MDRSRRHLRSLLVLLLLVSVVSAASSASFCKCTCFSKSIIIALNEDSDKSGQKKARKTCNDCNKKFCLEYDLPNCSNAGPDDVTTTCFQRDSAKDQAFVLIFIIATVGLLVYAAIRPWLQKTIEVRTTFGVITLGLRRR
ncbi:MAG: hypothetical protein M1820_005588 [Bogoriella megaspora]|nr:MAG: hypothetical protein M1820_005588 [Bogoriella megaspora]